MQRTKRSDTIATADVAGRSAMAVGDLVDAVLQSWTEVDARSDQTITRMGELAVRFSRRLRATGVETVADIDAAVCAGFIHAPTRTGDVPTVFTRHFRRTTLRAVFRSARELGIVSGDPTLDLKLPPKTNLAARPLTDDEIMLCRTTSFSAHAADLRRPAAWALAEATAATSEIPLIRRCDLHPAGAVDAVTLPGNRNTRPRTAELTDWGISIINRRLAELPADPHTLVAYTGSAGPRTVARHAAACQLIAGVLASTGLAAEPDIRPSSVRHWRARTELDAGARIEDVANLLGHRSLDQTAEATAHHWRTP
jgi:integrase/recombinase XerC